MVLRETAPTKICKSEDWIQKGKKIIEIPHSSPERGATLLGSTIDVVLKEQWKCRGGGKKGKYLALGNMNLWHLMGTSLRGVRI